MLLKKNMHSCSVNYVGDLGKETYSIMSKTEKLFTS